MAANSLRWLSNWIVTPILRLGYRPLTLPRPLRTCRAGGDDRICWITRSACGLSPSRRHQSPNWCASSIQRSHDRTDTPVGSQRPVHGTEGSHQRFKAQAHGLQQPQRGVERVRRETAGEVIGPGDLEPMDLLDHLATLRGEADEFGSPMVGVVSKRNQPLRRKDVDCPLHALAGQPHLPGHVCYREWLLGDLDGAKDLPAGTGKPQGVRQAVPGGQQQSMQAEHLQNQIGQGFPGGRVCADDWLCVLHMTEGCHNDSLLSRWKCTLAHGLRPLPRITMPQDDERSGHDGASERREQGSDDGLRQSAEAVVQCLPHYGSLYARCQVMVPARRRERATATCK